MNIVIIERQSSDAEYLQNILTNLAPGIRILKQLSTVADAFCYFSKETSADLVFSGIHLADGTSFSIFEKMELPVPVVFIAPHAKYAIQAFKTMGIDYILRPFNTQSISQALYKYFLIRAAILKKTDYNDRFSTPADLSTNRPNPPTRLLVKYRDRITPIPITDIAFFQSENKALQLTTLGNIMYPLNKTLQDVESICGSRFYRVNRKLLLNKDAIEEITQGYSRTLLIKLKTYNQSDIIIHKAKVSDFLAWLSG